jgi:hypothetical protein
MTTRYKVYDNGVIHVGEIPKDYVEKALQRQKELIHRTLRYGRRFHHDQEGTDTGIEGRE